MMLRNRILASATLAVGAAMLSACGSGSATVTTEASSAAGVSPSASVQRNAAQRELHPPEVCPEQESSTVRWSILNNLSVPIAMHMVGPLPCDDWSGRSNPTVYNDLVIWPGQPVDLRLEVGNPGLLTDGMSNWTEQFTLADGKPVGDLNFWITASETPAALFMCDRGKCRSFLTVPLHNPAPEASGFATFAQVDGGNGQLTFHK